MIQSRNKIGDLGKNLRLMTAKSQRRALKAVKEQAGSFADINQGGIYKKLHMNHFLRGLLQGPISVKAALAHQLTL